MDTPCEVCEKRDVKGLYKKAREGKIKGIRITLCVRVYIAKCSRAHTIMMAATFSDNFSNLVQVLLESTVPMRHQRILILC